MKIAFGLYFSVLPVIVSVVRGEDACNPFVQKTMTIPYTSSGQDIRFNFGVLPPAGSDVSISAVFQADLGGFGQVREYADVRIGNRILFRLGQSSGTNYSPSLEGNCVRDEASTTISATRFNSFISTSPTTEVIISLDATDQVGTFCNDDKGIVTISYTQNCACIPTVEQELTLPYEREGQRIRFNFGVLPQAISDVTITATFQADTGDLFNLFEYADVNFDGTYLFRLGRRDSGTTFTLNPNCRRDQDSRMISASVFNSLVNSAGNNEIVIEIDATAAVGTFCDDDKGTVKLSYTQNCACAVEQELRLPYTSDGQNLFFNFGVLPEAVSDVTVFASLAADLNGHNAAEEFANVEVLSSTNEFLFRLGDSTGTQYTNNVNCYRDEKSATLPAATFNSLVASNPNAQFHIGLDATSAVNTFCPNDRGIVRISYSRCGEISSNGDPHFRTWQNEHFEFHGQCDVVMSSVKNFANRDIDLDIHLRTKMVRHWSFIKTAAIRIGDDILEIEGSAAKEDCIDKRHYWINYEYLGELTNLAGFPVTISPRNNLYTIDLDSAYPGQKIEIKTFKEFVGVKVLGATEESFGSSVGIIGDFNTGKTLSRDGATEIHDFNDLGLEWQVLPSDGKLFREASPPQFPELCLLPEDPRGERTRRLGESDVSEEAAEAACAGLKEELDRKDCIYDVLATQDMEMAGAY